MTRKYSKLEGMLCKFIENKTDMGKTHKEGHELLDKLKDKIPEDVGKKFRIHLNMSMGVTGLSMVLGFVWAYGVVWGGGMLAKWNEFQANLPKEMGPERMYKTVFEIGKVTLYYQPEMIAAGLVGAYLFYKVNKHSIYKKDKKLVKELREKVKFYC